MIIIDMQYFGGKGAASGKSGAGGSINYKEVDDSIFDNSVNRWENDITYDEENTVFDYTGALYSPLNESLRDGDTRGFENEIKNLDSAIKKFNLEDNIVVYRGIGSGGSKNLFGSYNITPEMINSNFVGTVIQDKAYMSTSIKSSVAYDFSSPIIKINVPKGKGRGAYVNSVSQYKNKEYEFLMKRGSNLKITGADKSMGVTTIYADLV